MNIGIQIKYTSFILKYYRYR